MKSKNETQSQKMDRVIRLLELIHNQNMQAWQAKNANHGCPCGSCFHYAKHPSITYWSGNVGNAGGGGCTPGNSGTSTTNTDPRT